jgi:CRP-like cAMP-binding protein
MAPDVSNDLIERLPRRDRTRLRAACERVELVLAAPVCVRGAEAGHAYFPTRAFISLLARVDHHPAIEVGMVGSEGMLGAEILLGICQSPFDAVVQGQGEVLRIDVRRFRTELECSLPLRRTLSRYLHVRMLQLARASGCHRFHAVAPRLARWLLMSQDRAHGNRFEMTHEFLASMLGVRRSGVTLAAGVLQRGGLIRYTRGELTVLDRQGMETAACSCYAADQLTYAEGFA